MVIPTIETGGGAEKIAVSLSILLSKTEEYNVRLLTFYDKSEEYKFDGERISLREKQKESKLIKLIRRSLKIKKMCKDKKIDTAISFIEEANFPLVISKFLGNRAKMIVSVRNNPLVHRKSIFYKLLILMLYRFANKVVMNSKEAESIMRDSFWLENVISIWNHHPIEKYDVFSREKTNLDNKIFNNDNFIFINVGRLAEQKGHKHLIRSFKYVADKCKNARLVILGAGNEENALKDLAIKNKINNKIFFLGKVNNVFPFLKNSDCFVLSSIREGLPNAVIEALACNIPVISTDCRTGPREILTPELGMGRKIYYPYFGKYGILTPPFGESKKNDRMAEKVLADVMIKIASDSNMRNKYLNGIARAMDFDEGNILTKWEEII